MSEPTEAHDEGYPMLNGIRVMIAEDEPFVVATLSDAVENAGAAVVE
jgi:hypothetical protein